MQSFLKRLPDDHFSLVTSIYLFIFIFNIYVRNFIICKIDLTGFRSGSFIYFFQIPKVYQGVSLTQEERNVDPTLKA